MKIRHSAQPRLRVIVIVSFMTLCAAFFGYLWVNMGGSIPGLSKDGYRVSAQLEDADNLVFDSDVMIAGVRVGKVRKLDHQGGKARVVIQLNSADAEPLHKGAVVHVRSKTLIEESYLDIIDGHGPEVPNGAALPPSAVTSGVQLNDVLEGLDAPTRKALGGAIRSLGSGTQGRQADIARTMKGLGILGRQGHDVLDALAAQSEDLKVMTRQSTVLLGALDARRGQIVSLVGDANRLTKVTQADRRPIEQTMRRLPKVMSGAQKASGSLNTLSAGLGPVAKDIDKAAPDLNKALVQVPAVTKDLRGLLPALNATLVRAPATLRRVPAVAHDAQDLVPTLQVALSDINPTLSFLEPYGPDLAAFFANWTAMLQQSDVNGHYLRIFGVLNEQSVKNSPLDTNVGPLKKSNAYPAPGESRDPGPYEGTYPRVKRENP